MQNITVNIRRHSISNKKDSKKDYSISSEGWDLAVAKGRELIVPEGGIVAYSSPKTRAQETARGVLFGAYLANYQTRQIVWNGQIIIVPELDSMAGYVTRIPNIKQVFDELPLDEGVNKIMREDPEAFERAGFEIESLLELAYQETSKVGKSVWIDSVTHGAKVEAGLVKLIGRGIKDIRELGGAFKETEGFSVELTSKTGFMPVYAVSLTLRGKTYEIGRTINE